VASTATATAKDFGCIPEGSDRSDWLWADREAAGCSARLFVISTPYYPGRHWARSAGEFLPLVAQLEQFHAQNFVHGDIRGTNIAFCDGPEGTCKLFDWDMGGKVRERADAGQDHAKPTVAGENSSNEGVLKYPKGLRDVIFDGTRHGLAGEPITKLHDWEALTGLILRCYSFLPPDNLPSDLFLVRERLGLFPQSGTGVDQHVADLRHFLSEADKLKWQVELENSFRKKLSHYGYLKDERTKY
jgi:hypothetical protein